MAASYHVRSNSLPSSPNPLAAQVDEHLSRLRSSETASTSSSSICQKFNNLQDLHDCVNKMLQLPLTRQALSQEQNRQKIEELLDGSLKILDVCNIAKDALLQTTENLNDIQSIFRRKRDGFTTEVKKYLASRKSLKKSFQKISKSLKTTEAKLQDDESLAMLRDVEAVTIALFDSLLCFISGSKVQSKASSKWSLVSKLMTQKRIACEEEESSTNEFSKADAALFSVLGTKSCENMKVEDLQSLEMTIQELEQGLECLFRCMIKVRVSVLNILGN